MMRRFVLDAAGASAVEFAALAPILAFVTLGMIDGWSLASSSLRMHAAIQAGAKYLIQGGSSTDNVHAIAAAAWSSAPDDASVSVSKACTCSGAAVACGGACAGNASMPQMTFTISASGSWQAPFNVSFLPSRQTLSESQIVRTR
jgi:Flp pilus assembly protein TadG